MDVSRRKIAGRRSFWLTLLAVALPHTAPAQAPAQGDRVRVVRHDRSAGVPAGRFDRASRDSVWIIGPGSREPFGVALRPGDRLERSVGQRSHVLTGALIGAGVGAGITLWFLNGFCDDPDTLCNGDEELRAAAFFGLPSIALGAGIGALIKSERWAPVVSAASGGGSGLRVGVAIRL